MASRVDIAPRLAVPGSRTWLYSPRVSDDDDVPPPPVLPAELLAWANAWAVVERLDDPVLASDGPVGTFLPARHGESFSYRQLLVELDPPDRRLSSYGPIVVRARALLHRIAILAARERRARAFLDEHGRDPSDEAVAGLLDRLRAELSALRDAGTAARPPGTYEPAGVRVVREPVPALRYHERYLIGEDRLSGRGPDDVGVMLLGWSDGPLRWMSWRDDKPGGGDIAPERRLAALQAMIDFIRDPRGDEQDALCDVARLPVWQFALGALDDRLSRIASASARGADPARGDERIAFRVIAFSDGAVRVEPVVQKRGRNGAYSPGKSLPWYKVPDYPARSAADERVFRAYDDPLRAAIGGLGRRAHAGADLRRAARAHRSPRGVLRRRRQRGPPGRRAARHPPGAAAAALRGWARRRADAAAGAGRRDAAARARWRRRCATIGTS